MRRLEGCGKTWGGDAGEEGERRKRVLLGGDPDCALLLFVFLRRHIGRRRKGDFTPGCHDQPGAACNWIDIPENSGSSLWRSRYFYDLEKEGVLSGFLGLTPAVGPGDGLRQVF